MYPKYIHRYNVACVSGEWLALVFIISLQIDCSKPKKNWIGRSGKDLFQRWKNKITCKHQYPSLSTHFFGLRGHLNRNYVQWARHSPSRSRWPHQAAVSALEGHQRSDQVGFIKASVRGITGEGSPGMGTHWTHLIGVVRSTLWLWLT